MRVERRNFALILDVDEDFSGSRAHAELRLTVERDRADYFPGSRLDGSRVVAAAIEGKHALGGWIEKDCVRILTNVLNLGDGFEGIEIEDGDRALAAVTGEAAAKTGSEGNAVDPGRVENVADLFPRVGLENDDVGSARDEQMAGVGINVQIIPSSFAADFVGFDHMQPGVLGGSHAHGD